MNVDQFLELINLICWIVATVVILWLLWRDMRIAGLSAALWNLISLRMVVIALVLISLGTLNWSLVYIPPQKTGVVLSILDPNGVRQEPLSPGLRWVMPLAEQLVSYPIDWQTYTMAYQPLEGEILGDDAIVAWTKDGQEVILNCSIIFRIQRTQAVRIHTEWQNRYLNDFVRPVVRGEVRSQVARFTVDEVNSVQRTALETDLNRGLATIFADKGFILDRFILRNVAFSAEYARSVEQKQVQEQGQIESLYRAERIRRIAQGKADAIIVEAEAEARALQLIHQVLQQNPNLLVYQYIDKLSPNVKVMFLPNNAPFIFPLAPETYLDNPAVSLTDTLELLDPLTATLTITK